MTTVTGVCPECHMDTLEFEYTGTQLSPEFHGLVKQDCDCVLTDAEVERERTRLVEDPEICFGRAA